MVSYATPYSFTMLEIPCNPAVSSSVSFTGDMTFTIQQPGDKCFIVPKNELYQCAITNYANS